MTPGSFLAVLKDGTHRTMTGMFPSADPAAFRRWVRQHTHDIRYNIARFVYAWGGEMQEYTASEVREVYHGPGPATDPITYQYPE